MAWAPLFGLAERWLVIAWYYEESSACRLLIKMAKYLTF